MALAHVLAWRLTYAGMLPDSVIAAQTIGARAAYWRDVLAQAPCRASYRVAVVPDGVIGFVAAGPARSPADPCVAEIYALYLLPAWQRRGFGRRLLCDAASCLATNGFDQAHLWVFETNTRACQFCRALGARVADTREVRMGLRPVTEVAYAWRPLAATTASPERG